MSQVDVKKTKRRMRCAIYTRKSTDQGLDQEFSSLDNQRERGEAWAQGAYGKWLGLTLLNLTIGYGLGVRYFRVLHWVLGLTFLGANVIDASGAALGKDPFWVFACSFDLLLPLIELKKEYGTFVQASLSGWPELYFYLHKIMGYLLASFLVAGLGGLTQR